MVINEYLLVQTCSVYFCLPSRMDLINFTIPHPATATICGSTGSGKTHLTLELIRRRREIFSEPLEKVVYICCDFQPAFYKLQAVDSDVRFTQNIKELETLTGPCLVIVDDFQDSLAKGELNELITKVYLKYSHHRNYSIVTLLQNPFSPGLRNVNINTQILILTDCPRDRSIIINISRQITPGRTQLLTQAYNAAVSNREFGYLVIDMSPRNKKFKYWLRSHLFPCGECQVYTE